MTYVWIITFLLITIVMFLIVPKKNILRFSSFGLVAGFILGLAMLYFMVTMFKYWSFTPDFLTFAGIPIFLALTWWPLEIVYAQYFIKGGIKDFASYALVLVPPILSTLFHALAISMNLLEYTGWSYFATFLVSVVVHLLLAFYLRAKVRTREFV